jgi:hypothetical protein
MTEEDVCDLAFWDQNVEVASMLKLSVTKLKEEAASDLRSFDPRERCSRSGWTRLVAKIEGIKWAIAWLPTFLNPERTLCKPSHLQQMRNGHTTYFAEHPDEAASVMDARAAEEFLKARQPPEGTLDLARYVDRSVLTRLTRKEVTEQELQVDERLCRCRQRDADKLFGRLQAARDELALWLKDLPRLVGEACGEAWVRDDEYPSQPNEARPI